MKCNLSDSDMREGNKKRRHPKRAATPEGKKILLLHGNRQTGQLLLGRLAKLQKRLHKELQLQLVAPDAPFLLTADAHEGNDSDIYLTWWNRVGNEYQGLDTTLELLKSPMWNSEHIIGIMGFSQGARLAHLLTLLRHPRGSDNQTNPWFPNLKFVIMVAGYDAPLPSGHWSTFPSHPGKLKIPSLHVWGLTDALISPTMSEALSELYEDPKVHVHPGNHYVPTKESDTQAFMSFIRTAATTNHYSVTKYDQWNHEMEKISEEVRTGTAPDEETAAMQHDEIEALQAIFPDEIEIKSPFHHINETLKLTFPIRYHLKLLPNEDNKNASKWPIHPLTLEIVYPSDYPMEAIPLFRLIHENNNYEFPTSYSDKMLSMLKESSQMELGMPSVLSGIYVVKEYLDAPPSANEDAIKNPITRSPSTVLKLESTSTSIGHGERLNTGDQEVLIRASSPEKIHLSNLEGLEIAEQILLTEASNNMISTASQTAMKKKGSGGGSFGHYVIGLVGKPSAGKSTFFNAATAFSRQRSGLAGDVSSGSSGDIDWGGASMAAHPFTTIDPNIGYCLIPAPYGSCPEDSTDTPTRFGSTHGRSPEGRRFLPVLLKDVAGLVPGAYLGKGRGNQFLNDLTDANVLIHVVDASGTADAQGNKTATGNEISELTDPLDDLAWIRNELVEWVYSNLAKKWTTIIRKGRDRVSKMFSGYGQREVETQNILTALERYLEDRYQRDRALDRLEEWDQGDIHRLVSAFLGVRFPMALALNKCDLPSSQVYVQAIQESLPIHGAYAGTPMAAEQEMLFVRNHLKNEAQKSQNFPGHVWKCLTSALSLRQPILVFPVSDMITYAPLTGLNKCAAESASLPSSGMIRCINAAGGILPSCWVDAEQAYVVENKERSSRIRLRDVIIMKPGSTVEDVFLALKKLGALSGDFVRAEAAGDIGEKAKPVPKLEVMRKQYRIIKIMSNKRTAWQS